MQDSRVLVVDLDGTLYRCNTFHKFLKYLLKQYFFKLKPLRLLNLSYYCLLRGLRIISHNRLKYQVLKQLKTSVLNYHTFVASLAKYYNPIKELEDTPNQLKILATAAPYCYANIIANLHGFDACLATQTPQDDFQSFIELRGDNKKTCVLNFLKSKSMDTIDVCITDHLDDAPLVEVAKRTIVYNANSEFLKWLRNNFINFEARNI